MTSPRQPKVPPGAERHPSRRLAGIRPRTTFFSQGAQLCRSWFLKRSPSQLFALFWLLVFSTVLLLALVPGQSRFEAQVIATQLSFTTHFPSGEPRRRFLDSIRNLKGLSLQGSYSDTITLTGQFTSESLGTLSELSLEMPYEYSQLRLQPAIEADVTVPPELEVLALQLQDQTTVNALRYVPVNRRLELRFTHAEPPNPLAGSLLELYLGQQALKLTLEGYRLKLPGQVLEDPDGNQPLTFTFRPAIAELALSLPQTGSLSLSLPPLTDIDTLRWFWGNLPVRQLNFITEERRGTDLLQRSTIQSGTVRMGDREIDIEADQFLLLKEPGVQQIRYFQLTEKKGIEVRARGATSAAQIGLDPDFPVRGLRSNIIARVFSPDVVVAIVSFSGAMVATLLSWCIDNLFKKEA